MSISRLLELGKRSLLTSQSAIQTTAGNIANVNTDGYTRRRINLSNLSIGAPNGFQIGLGVTADSFSRIRQGFVDEQFRRENHSLGRFETDARILSQVEGTLAENSDAGLTTALQQFWDSWNSLAGEPESTAGRLVVRDKAVALGNAFQRVHEGLTVTQGQLAREVEAEVVAINRLTAELSNINKQVLQGGSPDLLDERDRLLNELSARIPIHVAEQEDRTIDVSSGGLKLVAGVENVDLTAEIAESNGRFSAAISIDEFDHDPNFTSGQLGSLLQQLNGTIAGYLDNLDALAVHVANKVNNIHSSGYNLDGITGLAFFDASTSGAADIRLNSALQNNAGLIATRSGSGGSADNTIAQQIYDLQYAGDMKGETINGFYASLTSELGSQLREARSLESSQKLISEQLLNQRDAISGVSLDEEMTRLIQYQQSYEASARLISTVDQLMDTLLSIV